MEYEYNVDKFIGKNHEKVLSLSKAEWRFAAVKRWVFHRGK
jgi:hypothetical protein